MDPSSPSCKLNCSSALCKNLLLSLYHKRLFKIFLPQIKHLQPSSIDNSVTTLTCFGVFSPCCIKCFFHFWEILPQLRFNFCYLFLQGWEKMALTLNKCLSLLLVTPVFLNLIPWIPCDFCYWGMLLSHLIIATASSPCWNATTEPK